MSKKPDNLLNKFTPELLERLHARQISGKEVARQLGISQTHLSRVLSAQGFKRVPGPVPAQRQANSELAKTRIAHRTSLAAKVAAGSMPVTDACKSAGCAERTMWRYVAQIKALANPDAMA